MICRGIFKHHLLDWFLCIPRFAAGRLYCIASRFVRATPSTLELALISPSFSILRRREDVVVATATYVLTGGNLPPSLQKIYCKYLPGHSCCPRLVTASFNI
ncbi:hypothetical protein PGT21_030092 [Puccinia graminis f. sp. tritici]|uniref:Secreted protein n=1 Tax=Puccinia graminis f. sp. tritici TaxID=56615 RepID=A0A5B0RMV2_PUCGR|nr:hypothetical protein PGT21_030092 [Puccinia graminis f. sp. tritici]KAA1126662.1 hypothetical protein PGTUg99_032179 [Puccinia graminis f. sp. tritici]